MMPAIELTEQQKQNWIAFRKLAEETSHKAKKNKISKEEVASVEATLKTFKGDFTYAELLEKSGVHPVILRRIISILKEQGKLIKVSHKYWRALI